MAFLYSLHRELNQSSDMNGFSSNCDSDGKVWPSNRIFDDVCLKFLCDQCYNTYCEYRHTLPQPEIVEGRLKNATQEEIEEAQNQILLRYDMLMSQFFTVFCTFFGREWQMHRENLRQMIFVLSKKAAAADYMRDILNGFLISGMPYSTCVNQLLIEIDDTLDQDEQFNILWQLIIDARNGKVNEHLNQFQTALQNNSAAVDKILNYQINDQLAELRECTVNLLKKCPVTTFRQIDSKLLGKFVFHLKSCDKNAGQVIQQRAVQFHLVLDN